MDSPPESPLEPLTQAVASFGDPCYEHRREKRAIAPNVQKRMKLAVFGNKQDCRYPDSPANGKSQDEKGTDLMLLDPHGHSLLSIKVVPISIDRDKSDAGPRLYLGHAFHLQEVESDCRHRE